MLLLFGFVASLVVSLNLPCTFISYFFVNITKNFVGTINTFVFLFYIHNKHFVFVVVLRLVLFSFWERFDIIFELCGQEEWVRFLTTPVLSY
jgi:hypothetical protein